MVVLLLTYNVVNLCHGCCGIHGCFGMCLDEKLYWISLLNVGGFSWLKHPATVVITWSNHMVE